MPEEQTITRIIYVDRDEDNPMYLSQYGFAGASERYPVTFSPLVEAFRRDYKGYRFLITDLSFGMEGVVIPETHGNRVASFAKESNPDIVCILTTGVYGDIRPEERSLFAKVFRWDTDLPTGIKAYEGLAMWIMLRDKLLRTQEKCRK